VAIKIAKTVPKWIEGKFEALDPTLVEITTEEWQTELRRLIKTNLINEFPKQKELQKFMADVLNHTKQFFHLARSLRTKGLVDRHWRMLGKALNVDLDPQ